MIGVARRFAAIGGWGAGFALLWIIAAELGLAHWRGSTRGLSQ